MGPQSGCAAGFLRSHPGLLVKLKLVGFSHARFVWVGMRKIGFMSSPKSELRPSMYLPMLALTAVLPFPNRSKATPARGVMSFQLTPWVDPVGNETTVGRRRYSGPPIGSEV